MKELLDSSLGLVGRPWAPTPGPDARGCRAWLREPRGYTFLAEFWLQVWNHLLSAWDGAGQLEEEMPLPGEAEGRKRPVSWCPASLPGARGTTAPKEGASQPAHRPTRTCQGTTQRQLPKSQLQLAPLAQHAPIPTPEGGQTCH